MTTRSMFLADAIPAEGTGRTPCHLRFDVEVAFRIGLGLNIRCFPMTAAKTSQRPR